MYMKSQKVELCLCVCVCVSFGVLRLSIRLEEILVLLFVL